jgi:hypothetical protein
MHYEGVIAAAASVATVALSIGILFSSSGVDISGPVSWSLFTVGSRTFLVFGDFHMTKQGACVGAAPTVTAWITNVLKTSKHVVDVFLEIYKGVELQDDGFMQEAADTLGPCVEPSKCNFPRGRVHYVDVRAEPGGPLAKYDKIALQLFYPDAFGKYEGELPEVRAFVKDLRRLHRVSKTAKQLAMVREPGMAAAITKFYDRRQAEIASGDMPHDDKIIYLLALEMDLYALGRMFKTTKDGKTTTHNIIYAGTFHTDNYESFLGSVGRRVGGQTLKTGPDGPSQCVRLDGRVTRSFS